MDDRHVVIERDSGTGMGVVLGVILAIVVGMALMWFVFGANGFGMQGGGSQASPNTGPNINITVPKPDINISAPISAPVQLPAAPAQPAGGGTTP